MLAQFKRKFSLIISWFRNFYDHNIRNKKCYFKNLLILSLSLAFVASWLKQPLKSVFDDLLVSPVLSYFIIYPIDGYSFVFYVVLWIILIFYLIRRTVLSEYVLNRYVLIFIFLILGLYIGERLYWYKYTHLSLLNQFKVLDPIYFSLFLISLISVFNSIKWDFQEKIESWLELDLPKRKIEEDKLNRANEVDNFIQLLKSLPSNEKRSHVVGIVGSWGYGKTSFLSMFIEKLGKKSIVVEFNPWITSSTSNLIEDFFVLLDNKLSKYIQTNKTIYKYGKALSNLTQENSLIVEVKSLLFPERPLNERIKLISELVTKLDKEVYCIIDDLDRLDSEEVFEVLRIVRNTASFPNFTFIMAYDKKYLVHALKSKDIFNADKYLDKIVQVEVGLPWISKFKLRAELIELIQSKIEIAFIAEPNVQDALKKEVRNLILEDGVERDSKYSFDKSIISELFLNIRDIVKFSNSFVYFLKNHHSKIYVPDLFFLELIKFIDIGVISRLAANDYTDVRNSEGLNFYSIYEENENSEIETVLLSPSTTIDSILSNHSNKDLLKKLIQMCFSLPGEFDYNSKFSLCYVDNFEFYFSFYLNDNQVSFDYINNLIREDEV